MLIDTIGQIEGDLYLLGSSQVCIYCLKGEETILFEGGVTALVPLLRQQFNDYGITEENLCHQFILHSHYDHCGTVPFLKRTYPNLKIYASEKALEWWQNPKYLHFIAKTNRQVIESFNLQSLMKNFDVSIEEIPVDIIVEPGEQFSFGKYTLETMPAPGHSPCGMAIYVPELEFLLASDFAGMYLGKGSAYPLGFDDMDAYIESLKQFFNYNIKYLGLGHSGIITGDEIQHYLENSLQKAEQFRADVQTKVKTKEDAEKFCQEMMDRDYKGRMTTIPRNVMEKTFLVAIKNIWKKSG